MPERSLRGVEAQFNAVLQSGAAGHRVQLRCFSTRVPDHPDYEFVDALWESELDGMIVTGVEPQATDIPDEPLWPTLARLTDWAAEHTHSTLWSCMATQAAVYRLSGIRRQRLPQKLSGIYRCSRAADHPMLAGAPAQWPVCHSRYFDLDPAVLEAAGYRILAHGPGMPGSGGVDSFTITAGRSLFLMLQGHPEYGADSLLREYRRDIRRYLNGERASWPVLPANYFDATTAATLLNLQSNAASQSVEAIVAEVDVAMAAVPMPLWQPQASRLFGNWLNVLAAAKAPQTRTLQRASQ